MSERDILRLGISLAATFLLLAVISGAIPMGPLHGWVGYHLALAGAASVAIATFMPHFGVTLAGTRPEPWPVRLAGVLGVALGMGLVAFGRPLGGDGLAAAGGVIVLGGLLVTGWTTFGPMRSGLARRHPIAWVTYGVALADVAVGITLAVLFLLRWPPVAGAWVSLKPAHVWLNLFGFVSLTIAGTLIYLYPTFVGARIRPTPAVAVAVIGLMAGPLSVAAGAALGLDWLARGGGFAVVLGSAGLLWHGIDAWRRRGRWTTDLGWHSLTARHGIAAMVWFVAASLAAFAGLLRDGAAPLGWSVGVMAVPLVAGWVTQVLVAAWTHLLPAVGPGDATSRAAQRQVLARWGTARFAAWNAGVALLWPGLATGTAPLIAAGAVLFGAAGVLSLAFLGWALGGRPVDIAPRS